MQPLKPAKIIKPKVKDWIKAQMAVGLTREEAKSAYRSLDDQEVWRNEKYVVLVYNHPQYIWLSIRRDDRKAIHDWREMQQIKNDIVGREHEGVELYPAESRKVDAANQYHMFVMRDPEYRFPFGFESGGVSDTPFMSSQQRPFD